MNRSKSTNTLLSLAAFLVLAAAQIVSATEIRECGDIDSYRAEPYVALAAELQTLERTDAIARLRQWAESHKYDEQVIILCRMLFKPRTSAEFRAPMLGAPQFYGETTAKNWPIEPITLVDDIPFLIVIGYEVGGHPEEGYSYLNYCLSNANWTSRRYHAVSKQEIDAAFEKLLKSSPWKRPLSKWELGLLAKQIE